MDLIFHSLTNTVNFVSTALTKSIPHIQLIYASIDLAKNVYDVGMGRVSVVDSSINFISNLAGAFASIFFVAKIGGALLTGNPILGTIIGMGIASVAYTITLYSKFLWLCNCKFL